ncbi:hypothetical protein WJX72_008972 [[Myrmecia] bisecta]|uniref:SET domain-containing protein n=1 Tax=[Myrmecia] bisecta TaxID=41462 RepID=A0AAW1R8T6_9CHLO
MVLFRGFLGNVVGSAFVTALAGRFGLPTAVLEGLWRFQVPGPGAAAAAAQGEAQTHSSLSRDRRRQAKREIRLGGAESIYVHRIAAEHVVATAHFAQLEHLVICALLCIVNFILSQLSSSRWGALQATKSPVVPVLAVLWALYLLFQVEFTTGVAGAGDRAAMLVVGAVGGLVAAVLLWWVPAFQLGPAAGGLSQLIQHRMQSADLRAQALAADLASPVVLTACLACFAAVASALLLAAAMRTVRSLGLALHPPAWSRGYTQLGRGTAALLRASVVLPLLVSLLGVAPLAEGIFELSPPTWGLVKAGVLLVSSAVQLAAFRPLLQSYFNMTLVNWWTLKHGVTPATDQDKAQAQAAAGRMRRSAALHQALLGKVAVQALAPGLMMLACAFVVLPSSFEMLHAEAASEQHSVQLFWQSVGWFSAGHSMEVILQEESYAAVLYDDQLEKRCAYTFASKTEAGPLLRHAPPATIRLAARVLWRYHRESATQLAGGAGNAGCRFRLIESLQHHWDDLSDAKKITFAQMAAVTREYMSGAQDCFVPDAKQIAYLLSRFACNNHTICDDELHPIGVGIFPTGALLNHSSNPNAMQSFCGTQIVFRALRPIVAGEEVCISYIELAATAAEQRMSLLDSYYFDLDPRLTQAQMAVPLRRVRLATDWGPSVHFHIYATPPWPLDARDTHLTACQTADGETCLDCGVAARHLSAAGTSTCYNLPAYDDVAALQSQGGIEISCWGSRFLKDSGLAEQLATGLALLVHQLSEAKSSSAARGLASLTASLTPLDQGDIRLGSCHLWRLRLQEALLRAAVEEGRSWLVALQAARALTPLFKLAYPPVWPNLGLHLAMHAKLALHQNFVAEALQAANAALNVLQYTHPGSKSVLDDVLATKHVAADLLHPDT